MRSSKVTVCTGEPSKTGTKRDRPRNKGSRRDSGNSQFPPVACWVIGVLLSGCLDFVGAATTLGEPCQKDGDCFQWRHEGESVVVQVCADQVCMPASCTGDGPCPPGYRCAVRSLDQEDDRRCFPLCESSLEDREDQCPAGLTCAQGRELCLPPS